jgi:phosphotransferase system  glucose/maltose/N-acetylglucosamine-specific IIC component
MLCFAGKKELSMQKFLLFFGGVVFAAIAAFVFSFFTFRLSISSEELEIIGRLPQTAQRFEEGANLIQKNKNALCYEDRATCWEYLEAAAESESVGWGIAHAAIADRKALSKKLDFSFWESLCAGTLFYTHSRWYVIEEPSMYAYQSSMVFSPTWDE